MIVKTFFTDGFVRAITTNLSKFEDLFVVSSFSAFQYRESKKKPAAIAQELGVRYLLSGDVRPGSERLVINAQLTDARSGKALWAERYDTPRTGVFDLQDELSARIAATLVESLERNARQQAKSSDPRNLTAYELLLRGTNPKVERQALVEAIGLIEEAIELDPNYAGAYASLASHHLTLWRHSLAEDLDAALRQARAAATPRRRARP